MRCGKGFIHLGRDSLHMLQLLRHRGIGSGHNWVLAGGHRFGGDMEALTKSRARSRITFIESKPKVFSSLKTLQRLERKFSRLWSPFQVPMKLLDAKKAQPFIQPGRAKARRLIQARYATKNEAS
jgi:hypothetical protein